MKTTKLKLFAAITTASLMLLASCKNISANGSYKDNNHKESEVPITLTLSNLNEDGTFARTIEPVALTTGADSKIKAYLLEAICQFDNKSTLIKGDDKTALEAGTYVYTFTSATYWHLTLTALDNETDGKPLLKGTADLDLTKSTETTLEFKLSSKGVSTPGEYELYLYYDDASHWKDEFKLKYGIYDVVTGQVIGSETTPATAVAENNSVKSTDFDTADSYKGYKATGSSIVPGSYVFGVTMYNGSDVEIGYWSDVLMIEPGQTTKVKVKIPAVLGAVPDSPTDLKAQRIIGSEKDGYYNVRFYWTDTSTNEKYFKFVLKEYDDTKTATAGYNPLDNNDSDGLVLNYTVFGQTGDIEYIAGSLFAGSQELVLRLPTGRLFDAEIYAINKLGSSDADDVKSGDQPCVRVKDETASSTVLAAVDTNGSAGASKTAITSLVGSNVEGYDIDDGETTPVSVFLKHINLVQITYNLNGGNLYEYNSSTSSYQKLPDRNMIKYVIYDKNTEADDNDKNIALLSSSQILASGETDNTKIKIVKTVEAQDYFWSCWLNQSDGTKIQYTSTFNDLTVTAGYANNDLTFTISITGIPEISDGLVTAYFGTDSATKYISTTTGATNAKNLSIDAKTVKYITVSISQELLSAEGCTWKKFKLVIDGADIGEISAKATPVNGYINFANLSTSATTALQESGLHTVNVIGLLTDGRYLSNTFTVDIQR